MDKKHTINIEDYKFYVGRHNLALSHGRTSNKELNFCMSIDESLETITCYEVRSWDKMEIFYDFTKAVEYYNSI